MCLSWLLLVLLLGLPYAVRPRSCDWYKLLLLGCTLRPRSCSTLLALRHAHQLVSHGPSTVENGSSFLCCACMAGVCWCCSKSPSRRARHHWSKDAVWALSKPSEDAYRRQASFLDTRRLNLRVWRAKRRARFTSHGRVAAASEGVGLLTALPATAAAKRNANKAPERKLSHLQCYTATQEPRARGRIRADRRRRLGITLV